MEAEHAEGTTSLFRSGGRPANPFRVVSSRATSWRLRVIHHGVSTSVPAAVISHPSTPPQDERTSVLTTFPWSMSTVLEATSKPHLRPVLPISPPLQQFSLSLSLFSSAFRDQSVFVDELDFHLSFPIWRLASSSWRFWFSSGCLLTPFARWFLRLSKVSEIFRKKDSFPSWRRLYTIVEKDSLTGFYLIAEPGVTLYTFTVFYIVALWYGTVKSVLKLRARATHSCSTAFQPDSYSNDLTTVNSSIESTSQRLRIFSDRFHVLTIWSWQTCLVATIMEFQNVYRDTRDSHLPKNVTIPFVCLRAAIANIPRPPKYRILPPVILSETITQLLLYYSLTYLFFVIVNL